MNTVLGIINFDYSASGYRCKKPWISMMAQGQAISVLIRSCSLSNLNIAEKALKLYLVPQIEGGGLRTDNNSFYWYEEYPGSRNASALNGFIFALVGAGEMWEYSGSKLAKEIFDKGINTLKNCLSDFELILPFFKWSRYDDKLMIHSGRKYHELHVKQLRLLYELSGESVFQKYYKKWLEWQRRYGRSIFYGPYEIFCRGFTKLAGIVEVVARHE